MGALWTLALFVVFSKLLVHLGVAAPASTLVSTLQALVTHITLDASPELLVKIYSKRLHRQGVVMDLLGHLEV
jgi:hypothetical protein